MTDPLSAALPSEVEADVRRVLEQACEREIKLVTAESCTGGLLASLFTDVPGRSHAFERGFVVYTDDAKHELLDVPLTLLESEGAVSEPVARAMAEGALMHSKGHLSVSITGFAGSSGPEDEPGLVHFAVAARNASTEHRVERFGDVGRAEVRLQSVKVALEMLQQAHCRRECFGASTKISTMKASKFAGLPQPRARG